MGKWKRLYKSSEIQKKMKNADPKSYNIMSKLVHLESGQHKH